MARNPKNTRMCIACRTRGDKSDFIRIAKTKDSIIIANSGFQLEGRSVYLCASQKCLDMAIKRKAISRGLKCEIGSETTEALQKAIKSE